MALERDELAAAQSRMAAALVEGRWRDAAAAVFSALSRLSAPSPWVGEPGKCMFSDAGPVAWEIRGGEVSVMLRGGESVSGWMDRVGCTRAEGVSFHVGSPLPPAPSPVKCDAPRPEWVRIKEGPGWFPPFTRKVLRWEFGRPIVHAASPVSGQLDNTDTITLDPDDWEPCPAPSSPPSCDAPEPPATYVPKVGDVVQFDAAFTDNKSGVVVAIDEARQVAIIVRFGEAPSKPKWERYFYDVRFLGKADDIERINAGLPASASERAAAGLPPAEATFDELKERDAARTAWSLDKYVGPGESAVNAYVAGWLARAAAPTAGWMPMLRVEATECPACGARFDSVKAPTAPRSVDREGLAKAIRGGLFTPEEIAKYPWDSQHAGCRADYLRAADAAIAYFKNGGVA